MGLNSSSRAWPSEIELLLACARKALRPADRERAARAVAAGVDWQRVLSYAHAHGLLPFLSLHAGEIGAPAATRDQLGSQARHIAKRSLTLTRELLAILEACARAGVPAVPLKGPVLSDRAFGSVAFRHYRDLDILFRKADLAVAAEILASRGYAVEAIPKKGQFTLHNGHELVAFSQSAGIQVELHYALLTPRGRERQDLETLEQVLEPRVFCGTTVASLPCELEVDYLCEHGAVHAWSRLEWIATVDRLDPRASRLAAPRVRAARALADHLFHGADAPGTSRTARANAIVISRLRHAPARNLALPTESYRYQQLTEPGIRRRVHRAVMTFAYPALYDLEELPGWLAATPARFLARPIALVARRVRGER